MSKNLLCTSKINKAIPTISYIAVYDYIAHIKLFFPNHYVFKNYEEWTNVFFYKLGWNVHLTGLTFDHHNFGTCLTRYLDNLITYSLGR
jgi:hypothetical protein